MLFAFVVKPAMTIALKIRVSYLISEFLAHADIIRCFFKPAGAVAILLLETFSYNIYNLFIIIKFNLHVCFLFLCICYFSFIQRKFSVYCCFFRSAKKISVASSLFFLCIRHFSFIQRNFSVYRHFFLSAKKIPAAIFPCHSNTD